jgi:hypothetical protein
MSATRSDTDSLTVLAAAIAGIIQIMVTPGRFTLSSLMTGSILVLMLSTYHVTPEQRKIRLAGLAVVWALSIIIMFGVVLEIWADWLVEKVFEVPDFKYVSIPDGAPLSDRKRFDQINTFREAVIVGFWVLCSLGVYLISYKKREAARRLIKGKELDMSCGTFFPTLPPDKSLNPTP